MTHTEPPSVDEETDPEIVHWYPPRHPTAQAQATGALTVAAVAIGAAALGAFAVGALAVGALAIGRLAVGRARFRELEIDRLTVRVLKVLER